MKRYTWLIKIRRWAMLTGITLILLSLNITVYADDDTKGENFLSDQYGMELYWHHVDENGYCVVVNDVALTLEEVKILTDAGELQSTILKRANPVIREISNMRQIDTSTAVVQIIPVMTFSLSQSIQPQGIQPQTLQIQINHNLQVINISSSFYIVETEEVQIEPPELPTINPDPDPPGQSAEERQPVIADDKKLEQWVIEEIEYEFPQQIAVLPAETEISAEIEEVIDNEDIEDMLSASEEVLDMRNEESIHVPKRQPGILKYAFVGTFSLSGIIAAIAGFSIFLDIKALIWNRKRRAEERRRRYCQR